MDESLKEFVMDQLAALPDLVAKPMFGGYGLYGRRNFFGILIKGRLYFLTNRKTVGDYKARGMASFTYEKGQRVVSKRYFEVPPDVLENRDELVTWAARAIEASAARKKIKRVGRKTAALALLLGIWSIAAQAQDSYLTNDWVFKSGSMSLTCPAVAPDGTIYYGTFTDRFWALTDGGALKWVFRAGLEIKSSPAIAADGTIYFGSRDRKFYALQSNGKKKWEFLTTGWVDSSPAIGSDGVVYFGSWDKTFYALGPDGTRRWVFLTGGPVVSSSSIDSNGVIYFGSHDQKFYALTADGVKKWEYATGGPIISSPALTHTGIIYFTSVDGFFYALKSDGTLAWRLRTGGVTESSPVIGLDGSLYVGVNKTLWAISPEGDKKWDRNVEDFIQATPVVLADGSVCFETGWGVMHNHAADQTYHWTYAGAGHAPPTVAASGAIYVSDGMHLNAVHNRVPMAKSSWPKFRGNSRNTGNLKDCEAATK